MADFSETWDSNNPSDSSNANQIDDFINSTRSMVEERLQDMVYGFTAGEDTDAPGFKKITVKQQASAAGSPNADEVVLYSIDDGTACGLYAKNEDGYATQILKKIGSTFTIPSGAYGADTIDEDDIRLANDSYLTGRNNAGDGDIDIIKVNTSDGITLGAVTTLPDTSALATSGAPAADAQLANKKYVDDQLDTKDFGEYTKEDDDSNAMVKAHAYLANQDGVVTAFFTSGSAKGNALSGFVGATTDPAGAGDMVARNHAGDTDHAAFISFRVPSGKYFECTGTGTVEIWWSPTGTLVKCTDQD